MSKNKALITGHRGMGVTEKPRHKFLDGKAFFAENSIAAFEQAIAEGADALECDIHVSSDHQAMVIHGSNLGPYADYIGTNATDPLTKLETGHKVEEYTREQLQTEFALKTFNIIVNNLQEFDALRPESREQLLQDTDIRQAIAATKKDELIQTPEYARIPTLTELLECAYTANRSRIAEGKPPLYLNIELKGAGSAVASLGAISRFYHQHAGEEHIRNPLPPEQIVFLGRSEPGEIVIANSLLKKNPASIETDWKEQFKEGCRTDEEFCRPFVEEDNMRANIAAIRECFPFVDNNPLLPRIIIASYIQENGTADTFREAIATPKFLEWLDRTDISQPFGERIYALSNATKETLDTIIKEKPEFSKVLTALSAACFASSTPAQRMGKAIDKKTADVWKTKDLVTRSLAQLTHQDETSLESIKRELGEARTTVMINTDQLFGSSAVVVGSRDFDTKPDITDITNAGRATLLNALATYHYDGVDFSLYDCTPGIINTLRQGIAASPHPERCILGMPASNWKGSEQENSLTTPEFAVMRADAIAEATGVPLLLKVDEPGMFKEKIEHWREIQTLPIIRGASTILRSDTITVSSSSCVIESTSSHPDLASVLTQKISSKPPRGESKEDRQDYQEAFLAEAHKIGSELKKRGYERINAINRSWVTKTSQPSGKDPFQLS